jgi:hypothetical protein
MHAWRRDESIGQVREQLLNDHRGPHAVQLVPGMAFFDRRPKVIAKRHGKFPLP